MPIKINLLIANFQLHTLTSWKSYIDMNMIIATYVLSPEIYLCPKIWCRVFPMLVSFLIICSNNDIKQEAMAAEDV